MRLWSQSQELGSTSQISPWLWQSESDVQVEDGTSQIPHKGLPGGLQTWPPWQVEELSQLDAPEVPVEPVELPVEALEAPLDEALEDDVAWHCRPQSTESPQTPPGPQSESWLQVHW